MQTQAVLSVDSVQSEAIETTDIIYKRKKKGGKRGVRFVESEFKPVSLIAN
jgi:hypothetical protein